MATTKKNETEQREALAQAVKDAYRDYFFSENKPVEVPRGNFLEAIAAALYEAGYRK